MLKKYPEITVEYFRFPEFVTKEYTPFDKKLIVPNNINTGPLYSFTTTKKTSDIQLFEGFKNQRFFNPRGYFWKQSEYSNQLSIGFRNIR